MKKKFFLALAAVGMLFTACSNDENIVTLNEESDAQCIVLQVENAGSGLTTRAGRELLSSEAKQSIENVKVIICDATNEIVKVKDISDWNTSAEAYTTGGHGKKQEWVLTGSDRLDAGTYKVYAFGYSNGTDYSDLATKLAALTVGATYTGNMVITTAQVYGEEIFAGDQTFTLATDKEAVKTNIVLHRQVAGAYIYVEELPYVAGVAKLCLYASDNNKKVVLGNFAPSSDNQLAANGGNTNNKVVNGTNGAGAQTLIASVNLIDWFSPIAEDANHLIDATNWVTTGHDAYVAGSVFMGKFLIPFQKTTVNTFVLQLEDASNNALRTWNIKLPTADALTTATTITYWNGTAFADNTSYTESVTMYSIFRNHLYGVGKKFTDTKNDDPTDPEKDDPESLNTKQTLVLMVNDNWEVLHTMEIE